MFGLSKTPTSSTSIMHPFVEGDGDIGSQHVGQIG
jgi:hypothetical protein